MVDRSESERKPGWVKYLKDKTYEVEVSLNDTVTLGDFDSTVDLVQALLWKKSDGSAVTCTVSKNVVTVTGTGTDVDCILYVVGLPA